MKNKKKTLDQFVESKNLIDVEKLKELKGGTVAVGIAAIYGAASIAG